MHSMIFYSDIKIISNFESFKVKMKRHFESINVILLLLKEDVGNREGVIQKRTALEF